MVIIYSVSSSYVLPGTVHWATQPYWLMKKYTLLQCLQLDQSAIRITGRAPGKMVLPSGVITVLLAEQNDLGARFYDDFGFLESWLYAWRLQRSTKTVFLLSFFIFSTRPLVPFFRYGGCCKSKSCCRGSTTDETTESRTATACSFCSAV